MIMKNNSRLSRRGFLKNSSVLAVGAIALPYWIPSGVLAADGRTGANDRVGVGVIGIGRRTKQVLAATPAEARIVAIADVNQPRCLEACKAYKADATANYHDLLAQGRRCHYHRHHRSLARLGLRPCLPGGKRRLCGKAAHADRSRRPADCGGGAKVRPRAADGGAAAFDDGEPRGL